MTIKDKDGVIHHPSNARYCPICMQLWIERENELAKNELAKIERDCMNCEKTFTTSNKENADFCEACR